jgi:hypothetical protein
MYQVWRVFKDNGTMIDFYVVNLKSRQVQSVWANVLDARRTCDKLNADTAKVIKLNERSAK